jgi:FtsH-binding integral membrane protein
MVNFGKLLKNKESFLLSTYGLLITQLTITFAIVYAFRNNPVVNKITRQSILIYFLLTFGIIMILSFVPMPIWLKLILFTVFAVVMGGMLHNVTVLIPINLVNNALIGTIAVFIAMSIFAFILASMGIDLSWMMIILLAALLGLIIASLIVMIFAKKDSKLHKAILIIGLIIFSVFVIVYTNTILQPSYNENFVDAALNFYLDFINIFTRILALEAD